MPHRAEKTRTLLRLHGAIGAVKKTPGRVPRQQPPDLLRRQYGAVLAERLSAARVRAAFEPLISALPRLEASAARDRVAATGARSDAVILDASGHPYREPYVMRADAGEARELQELIERGGRAMRASVSTREIEQLAEEFGKRTASWQRIQLVKQVRSALGIDIMMADPKIASMLETFMVRNAQLITAIPDEIAHKTGSSVLDALQRGKLHEDIAKELDARFSYGETRSRLIARDQVGKFYGQVNAARQQEIGIRRFIWRTVHDERVRDEHEELDGEEFEYANPPDEGLPGEPILCRCWADPVFDDILEGL